LPADFAVVAADGQDEGILVLIDDEGDHIVDEDRRGGNAVDISERAEGQAPALFAVASVAQQAEIGKNV
jgi:hypothetical protein